MARLLQHCGLWVPTFISAFLLPVLLISPIRAQDLSTSEKLREADALGIIAVRRAAEAREMCDCELLGAALESADKAAALLSQAAEEAETTGNLALAQKVYDMATKTVGPAIDFINEICTYCAQASLDIETVRCFEETCEAARSSRRLNDETKEAALAAGAIPTLPGFEVPTEPAVEDEEYIRDHEQPPASRM